MSYKDTIMPILELIVEYNLQTMCSSAECLTWNKERDMLVDKIDTLQELLFSAKSVIENKEFMEDR